jgi:hypothetical protein
MNDTPETTEQVALPSFIFWEDGKAPRYINERIQRLDRFQDPNCYYLWREWVTT